MSSAPRKYVLNFRRVFAAAVLVSAFEVFAQAAPVDSDLYYRRTHQGQLPPSGVNPADHSGETTNVVAAATNGVTKSIQPRNILDNGVNPTNLGKGDWIWQMPQTQARLGVSTVQAVIDYEKNLGMQWIAVKCGNGGSIWTQFDTDLITRAHAAGLKIFGWAYAYGNNSAHYGSTNSGNVIGEINVALNALALGADGFIIDGEIEYETNATRRADATLYASTIKSHYPTRFLAHAPFPYINSHAGFPYLEFGTNCDAVMPQDYWGAIGISPQTMVVNMNSKWITWQNSLTGFNTNAIKPIIPIGQSYAPVTGAEITAFLNALQTNSPKACASGYAGVSFWDAQSRNADMDAALLAASIGTNSLPPSVAVFPPLQRAVDAGGSVSFTSVVSGTPPLNYQWLRNGVKIPGSNTNYFNLTNTQTNQSGDYSLVVTNSVGSVTSSVGSLLVYPVQSTVFSDSFDSNTATNWIVNRSSSDTAVAFSFDYSTLGIPSAPHSTGGTTRGVQLKANLTLGVIAALSISPTNQNFSGDYRLHFDAWINVNGPFPGGGASSTEFLACGLGTTGNRTEWTGTGSTADGYYFSTDGDGGVSATSTTFGDYAGYSGKTWLTATSGIYAAGALDNLNSYYITAFPTGQSAPAWQQTNYAQQAGALNAGTFGLAWHDMMVSRRGGTIDWVIDGIRIATISNATLTASNVFVGFWDPFASLTDNANLSFGLVDNVRVEVPDPGFNQFLTAYDAGAGFFGGENLVLTNASGIKLYVWSSPYPSISVTNWTFEGPMTELPLGTSGNSRYGINLNPVASPVYYIFAKTNTGLFTATEAVTWLKTADFDSFNVTGSNAVISAAGIFAIATPPAILDPPLETNVFAGKNASFRVTATGSGTLGYQWLNGGFPLDDGGNVFGTHTNILSFLPAAAGHAGYYSVVVTNTLGSVTSSAARLNVVPIPALFLTNSENGLVLVAEGGALSNRYVIQMTTNLVPPIAWLPVQTNVIGADGQIRFTETNRAELFRFYRLLFP